MSRSLRSTSTRTFLALPALALAETTLTRRRPWFVFLLLLRWGSSGTACVATTDPARWGQPQHAATPGADRDERTLRDHHPQLMYLGHLVFLVFLNGLALATRSRGSRWRPRRCSPGSTRPPAATNGRCPSRSAPIRADVPHFWRSIWPPTSGGSGVDALGCVGGPGPAVAAV